MSLAASFVQLRASIAVRPWTFALYGLVVFLAARNAEQRYAEKGAPWPGLLLLASARWTGLVAFLLLIVHALIADACAKLWCSLMCVAHAMLHGAYLEVAVTDRGVRVGLVRRAQSPPPQPRPDAEPAAPASDEARTAS
jgi:hypothetical protein